MATMRGILLHLTTVTILLLSFMGSASAYADFQFHCHSEHSELVADTSLSFATSSASEHCHCDRESVHCCGPIFLFKAEAAEFSFKTPIANLFGDSADPLKPSPILDGPFQPPRA